MSPSFLNEYVTHTIEWCYSQGKPTCPKLSKTLNQLLDKHQITFPVVEELPRYGYPVFFHEDEDFDVISLLSTHGDELIRISENNSKTDIVKAEDLRGKYILLCCAFVPSLWIDKDAVFLRKLSLLYSEMSQMLGCNFEMVIVAKMRQKWDNDEGVFDHFFTAFSGCLAVPFRHKYRRDYICRYLGFGGKPLVIPVHPFQEIYDIDFHRSEDIVDYGARGFPFSHMDLVPLDGDDNLRDNTTLVELVGCESNPSSFLLRKFDSEEAISVEQLNEKHVGLYLFQRGDQLDKIHKIYKQCREEGLDFEVVLVFLPFNDSIHPKDFQDVVFCALKKFQISGWWVFPYNNSTCLRLYNLSVSNIYTSSEDAMIIVGPHNKFVDTRGGEIIYHYGFHFGTQMFPFTMEALVQAFMQRIEMITLDSFLAYDYVYQDYECDDTKIIPVAELIGKNVLVYMDIPFCLGPPWTLYDQVIQMYDEIKKIDSDFQLVFVSVLHPAADLDYPKLTSKVRECIHESKMKWLVCPIDDRKRSELLLKNDTFVPMDRLSIPSSVLAFGKDGRLHSLDALRLYWNHGLNAYPFLRESRNQILRREITCGLHID